MTDPKPGDTVPLTDFERQLAAAMQQQGTPDEPCPAPDELLALIEQEDAYVQADCLRQHLLACSACRSIYFELQNIRAAISIHK